MNQDILPPDLPRPASSPALDHSAAPKRDYVSDAQPAAGHPATPRGRTKRHSLTRGFAYLLLAVILVAAAALATYHYEHGKLITAVGNDNTLTSDVQTLNNKITTLENELKSTSQASSSSSSVIPPATVASKVTTCEQKVTTQNGTPSPINCPNDLNSTEWQALYKLYPASVMKLGYSATNAQIDAAVCSDLKSAKTSVAVENVTYQLSSLYYGWTYQPTLVSSQKC